MSGIYRALSPDELKFVYKKLTGDNINIVYYNDIIQADDIDELLNKNNCCVIYYPYVKTSEGMFGHYVALCKNNESYFYYDSLSGYPDEPKQNAASQQRMLLYRENHNSLIKHLLDKYNDGYTIDYNHYKNHKSLNPDVATCGRHSILRCYLSDMTNDDYNDLLIDIKNKFGYKKDKTLDKLVFDLTKKYLP